MVKGLAALRALRKGLIKKRDSAQQQVYRREREIKVDYTDRMPNETRIGSKKLRELEDDLRKNQGLVKQYDAEVVSLDKRIEVAKAAPGIQTDLFLKGKGGAIAKGIASVGAPLRQGKLYRPVTNPEFRKVTGRVAPGSQAANTTFILEPGNKKALGWIRKQTGAGKGTYMVKLHGAEWPSQGMLKGASVNVRTFNTKKKAEDFARKVLKGEDFALGGAVQKRGGGGITASRRIQRFQTGGGVDLAERRPYPSGIPKRQDGGGIYGLWKEHVPMTMRLPLQTLFGDRNKPFTEDDFTREELGEFEETIRYDQEQQRNKYESMIRGGQGKVDRTRDSLRMIETLTGALPVLMEAAKNDPEWIEYSGAEGTRKEELRASLVDKYTSLLPPEENSYFSPLLQRLVGEPPEKIEKEINYARSTFMPHKGMVASGQALQEQGEVGLANLPLQTRGSINSYRQYEDPRSAFGVNTALGKFDWEMKPPEVVEGSYRPGGRNITDVYDFYNEGRAPMVEKYEAMSPITRMLSAVGSELVLPLVSANIPGVPWQADLPGGHIGMAYIGREGRPIDINYDPDAVQKRGGGPIMSPMPRGITGLSRPTGRGPLYVPRGTLPMQAGGAVGPQQGGGMFLHPSAVQDPNFDVSRHLAPAPPITAPNFDVSGYLAPAPPITAPPITAPPASLFGNVYTPPIVPPAPISLTTDFRTLANNALGPNLGYTQDSPMPRRGDYDEEAGASEYRQELRGWRDAQGIPQPGSDRTGQEQARLMMLSLGMLPADTPDAPPGPETGLASIPSSLLPNFSPNIGLTGTPTSVAPQIPPPAPPEITPRSWPGLRPPPAGVPIIPPVAAVASPAPPGITPRPRPGLHPPPVGVPIIPPVAASPRGQRPRRSDYEAEGGAGEYRSDLRDWQAGRGYAQGGGVQHFQEGGGAEEMDDFFYDSENYGAEPEESGGILSLSKQPGFNLRDVTDFVFDPSSTLDKALLPLLFVPPVAAAAMLVKWGYKGTKLAKAMAHITNAQQQLPKWALGRPGPKAAKFTPEGAPIYTAKELAQAKPGRILGGPTTGRRSYVQAQVLGETAALPFSGGPKEPEDFRTQSYAEGGIVGLPVGI